MATAASGSSLSSYTMLYHTTAKTIALWHPWRAMRIPGWNEFGCSCLSSHGNPLLQENTVTPGDLVIALRRIQVIYPLKSPSGTGDGAWEIQSMSNSPERCCLIGKQVVHTSIQSIFSLCVLLSSVSLCSFPSVEPVPGFSQAMSLGTAPVTRVISAQRKKCDKFFTLGIFSLSHCWQLFW